MPLGSNDKKHYTAQDIERYHTGKMSAAEMHSLEKEALDDPFLADALEGYKLTPTPAADAAYLQAKLAEKTTNRKAAVYAMERKRSFPLLRIAALFILLAGTGWGIYYLSQTGKGPIALEPRDKVEKVTDVPVVQQSVTDTATTDALAAPAPMKDAIVLKPLNPNQNKTFFKEKSEPTISRNEVAQTEATANQEAVSFRANALSTLTDTAKVGNDKLASPVSVENAIKGRVVDERNNAVPFASITASRNRISTITNQDGYFYLPTPDTSLEATVNAVGFQQNRALLKNYTGDQTVVLKEASSTLDEVVVVGYGQKRKQALAAPTQISSQLEPTEGWTRFNDYIAQNIKVPEELTNDRQKGAVELSFDLSGEGKPTNIKVEKSLCEKCDQEAIRLLKEGPKWKKKKGKKGKVSIKFD